MPRRAVALLSLAAAVGAAGCGPKPADPAPEVSTKQPPVLSRPAEAPDAAQALGFPAFATKNTTRVGGADPIADAAGVALANFPSRTRETRPAVVALADAEDWRAAISAAQLAGPPLHAPILLSDGDELPPAAQEALDALRPAGAERAGDAQVIRVGAGTAAPESLKSTDLTGKDAAALAAAVDRLQTAAAGKPSGAVMVASSEAPGYAMPAAGYAAKAGVPVLWTSRDALPAATRSAIRAHRKPDIFVLGPKSVVSDEVLEQLEPLGDVRRIDAPDPVRHAVAFARFSAGGFGWNVVDPGHGLVFASSERPADAAAAAPLSAAGKYGPLLLVPDAGTLPQPVESYLLDIQPGYDRDPVRGVYNHGWILGDEDAISVEVQARLDTLLEIQPVDRPR